MIKVYFESNSHAELVATFESEEIYALCIKALEKDAKSKGMILTESAEEENEKFARKYSITGEGMNQGWYITGEYYSTQELADERAKSDGYFDFADMYQDYGSDGESNDDAYYTEWQDQDDYQYEMINGVLTEIE